jgi:tetratricopeptide (TPR) repeat protein
VSQLRNSYDILNRAKRADLTDALALLDASGAGAELLALCKVCLAARPEDRYADGTAVAQAVAAYRAGVEERTQRAERDRAAAEARAAEEANTRREAEARAEAERAARGEAEARANAEAKTWREQRKRSRAQLLLACAAVLLVAAGGAFAWYSADRATKEAQLEGDKKASDTRANAEADFKEKQARQGIDVNLQLSTNMRKVYNFPEADRLLVQALELAKSGAPDRVAEVERARTDLAFVVKLDDIRFRKWARVAELGGKGVFNTKIASPAYSEAFATYGLDLKSLTPADAAARISASKVKAELVSAVDDWSLYEPNSALSERLLAVAKLADPDSWLNRLRAPNVRLDKDAVATFATEVDVQSATPGALSVLARLLGHHKSDAMPIVVAGRARHPPDFELAFTCGLICKDGAQIGPYEAARALRPNNYAVWINLGSALADVGDAEGAIAAYKRAIELEPKIALAHSNLGNSLNGKGDIGKAVAACKRATELDPENALAHANFGYALLMNKDINSAFVACTRAIELDPKLAQAHLHLGTVLNEMGRTANAISSYKRAIDLQPNSGIAHSSLGWALCLKGDTDGALAACKRGIELAPKEARSHSNLGFVLLSRGEADGAIAACNRAIGLDPKLARAHYNLGCARAGKGDFDGAIVAFKRTIELDPTLAQAHTNLGSSLGSKGGVDGAITAFKRAIELDPKDAQTHCNLGFALKNKGDTDGAIAAFKRSLELDPEDALTHTNLGDTYFQRDSIQNA